MIKRISRKKLVTVIILLVLFASGVLNAQTSPPSQKTTLGEKVTPKASATSIPIWETPSVSLSDQATFSARTQAQVINVVDGDTVKVSINGETETVRLIGINTPETVDPRRPVQCFGKEASNKAKELLTGQTVYLESDDSQGNVDKYQRLLRYIWLTDGTNFNEFMIAEGYAYEYTYNVSYVYQEDFKQAQEEAQVAKEGLWGDNTCSGKR